MQVRYVGPFWNPSGYSSDARMTALALHTAGVELALEPVSFEEHSTGYGPVSELLRPLVRAAGASSAGWGVEIVHCIAPFVRSLSSKDRYTIWKTVWETDALHPSWVEQVRGSIDEIWVPCEFNAKVFRAAFDVPVRVFPHVHDVAGFDACRARADLTPYGIQEDDFVFLSTFDWTERKNAAGLIAAYCREFQPDERVVLLLKCYAGGTSPADQAETARRIAHAIRSTGLRETPKIRAITTLIPWEQLVGLYRRADAGAFLYRGEGWGLPLSELALCGKPSVATNWSAPVEYLGHRGWYPVEATLTPVRGMPETPHYDCRQRWAEPDLVMAGREMRFALHQGEREKRGAIARARVEGFTPEAIGAAMRARLEEVA